MEQDILEDEYLDFSVDDDGLYITTSTGPIMVVL